MVRNGMAHCSTRSLKHVEAISRLALDRVVVARSPEHSTLHPGLDDIVALLLGELRTVPLDDAPCRSVVGCAVGRRIAAAIGGPGFDVVEYPVDDRRRQVAP